MPEAPPSSAGLLDAAQRLGRSALGLFRSRLALLGLELQEEKLRALTLLTWLSVAFAVGTAGVLVAIGAMALFAWHQAGYVGLGALAAGCLAGAAAIVVAVRRSIRNGPPPFATTVDEFRKDLECLRDE
ncbi:MAG TPA: phage holin family protein [Opitutaceae bacterium]|nr:phage holin family protein [Opitutaceae bacterium]